MKSKRMAWMKIQMDLLYIKEMMKRLKMLTREQCKNSWLICMNLINNNYNKLFQVFCLETIEKEEEAKSKVSMKIMMMRIEFENLEDKMMNN